MYFEVAPTDQICPRIERPATAGTGMCLYQGTESLAYGVNQQQRPLLANLEHGSHVLVVGRADELRFDMTRRFHQRLGSARHLPHVSYALGSRRCTCIPRRFERHDISPTRFFLVTFDQVQSLPSSKVTPPRQFVNFTGAAIRQFSSLTKPKQSISKNWSKNA